MCRCLDKAATISDDETKSGEFCNGWRICTVTQVEEVKNINSNGAHMGNSDNIYISIHTDTYHVRGTCSSLLCSINSLYTILVSVLNTFFFIYIFWVYILAIRRHTFIFQVFFSYSRCLLTNLNFNFWTWKQT